MTAHEEKAKQLFMEGYNCAQAVFIAFAEDRMDRQTAAALASSFGGGMGGLREVCGALSGAFLALGLLEGSYDPNDRGAKTDRYAAVRAVAERFREENGTIICRELLGLSQDAKAENPSPRTKSYYEKRPCQEMVACAARILDRFLEEA